MKNLRKCYTCGAEYDYCPSCSGGGPEWKLLWDKEECKDIFEAISAYNLDLATADEVKAVLDEYGVKSYTGFRANIRKDLQKIVPASGQKTVDIDSKEKA